MFGMPNAPCQVMLRELPDGEWRRCMIDQQHHLGKHVDQYGRLFTVDALTPGRATRPTADLLTGLAEISVELAGSQVTLARLADRVNQLSALAAEGPPVGSALWDRRHILQQVRAALRWLGDPGEHEGPGCWAHYGSDRAARAVNRLTDLAEALEVDVLAATARPRLDPAGQMPGSPDAAAAFAAWAARGGAETHDRYPGRAGG